MARPRSVLGDSRHSPTVVQILRWLRRKPALARVVGDADDEGEVTCVVAGTSTPELHDVVSVVRDCTELRGFDEKGNELRRLKLDANDPEIRAEREVSAALQSNNVQGSVPIISVDVPKLVDSIARNIREAVSEATRNNSNAHRGGFEAMVSVMNIALNLLVGIEQRYANAEEALALRLQQQQQGGGEDDDPKRKLAMAALQQAMGGANGANGANGGGFDPTKLMAFMRSMQQSGAPGDDQNGS